MKLQRFFCLLMLAAPCGALADDITSPSREQLLQLSKQQTQEDQEARRIIRNADRVRAPEQPFRYTLNLVEYRNGAPTGLEQVLDVSMRFYKPSERAEKGDARALVRFTAPIRDKGKGLLSDFDSMWYYAPDLRRPIPISRQQRLMGQISNGDVVAADFDYSYISKLLGEEPCGERTCYKLSLQRRWPQVTYPAVMYWVEKGNFRPYRADFLSASGLLIKRTYYKDFREVLGAVRPHQIVVEDALRKDNYTTMSYSNVRLETLPESYFQKEYLMRMN